VEVTNVARQDVEKLIGTSGASASTIQIQEGEVAKTVCSFAKEAGADLLVIGRGPKDRMDGRLTAHAYAIIRQSPCPVLSI
jgi:nucleotide-binding universal stress UspA family protein